ncbi:Guanine Nucleotide-Binding Protein G(I) Subunit Alpha [Manis pentadactyla]|nr:Guanine Nucleotide-Binding Protein G(I) Subunit Alpha [Manis pentadactyla]
MSQPLTCGVIYYVIHFPGLLFSSSQDPMLIRGEAAIQRVSSPPSQPALYRVSLSLSQRVPRQQSGPRSRIQEQGIRLQFFSYRDISTCLPFSTITGGDLSSRYGTATAQL